MVRYRLLIILTALSVTLIACAAPDVAEPAQPVAEASPQATTAPPTATPVPTDIPTPIPEPTAEASPQATAAPPTATPEPMTEQTPEEVVTAFYNWYLGYSEQGSPMAEGGYRSSPYLTAAFIQQVDELIASFQSGGAYDPFLQAQNIPDSFTVEPATVSGDTAQVVVHFWLTGNPTPHDVLVTLTQEEGGWKIANIEMRGAGA